MWTSPITATPETSEEEIRELIKKHFVRDIPILDNKGRPCSIVHLDDIFSEENNCQCAVIMAGGEGRRLRPITENIPKPMIEVGGKPILENIINAVSRSGIFDIYITLNYKADIIKDYFKDGRRHGVQIKYIREDKKLGTAGSLTLLPKIPTGPLLVINGDVITKINYRMLIDFHKQHRCMMTVAAIQYSLKVPFGVLDLSGHYLLGVKEKPEQRFLCNAGMYMIEPEVLSLIPDGVEFDMTDLIKVLVKKGLPVTTFPVHEYWIDVGQMEDLKKAQNDFKDLNE
jgi:NDP-sugar pyrophosphorylase family protein